MLTNANCKLCGDAQKAELEFFYAHKKDWISLRNEGI
jgi:hypothetical protein